MAISTVFRQKLSLITMPSISRAVGRTTNYDAMIHWFDTDDFEFADWAKNNMDWSDVSDKAVLVKHIQPEPDFEDGWVNGEYRYYREE